MNYYSNKNKSNNKNKSHILKIKNFFFNLKDTNSVNISLSNKTKKDIGKENFSTEINNQKDKNTKEINNALKNEDDLDEQSYAFQNLLNLNKDKSVNEKINNNDICINEINLKNKKKKLEKSPDKAEFFMKDSKYYFNDDKQLKENNEIVNNYDMMKSKLKLDESSKKKYGYKSIKFGKYHKNKELLEYDGDMETVTFRDSFHKHDKINNNLENKYSNNYSNIDNIRNNEILKTKTITNDEIKEKSLRINTINDKPKEILEIIEPKLLKFENLKNKNIYNYNNFCDAFYISGIKSPLNIIKDSSEFFSTCGHKLCSTLNSLSPEILFFYKNEKLNLSEEKIGNLPKLSFPLGIKLCMINMNETKRMRNIPQQIFFNCTEDNNGKKIYLCTCFCYIKTTPEDFKQKYGYDINIFYSELYYKSNNNKNNNINHYYIPESITLISRYPFFNSMRICLHGFFSSILDDRINLLNHLINEVPIPCESIQIRFYSLLFSTPIILNHKMNLYKLMSIKNEEKRMSLLNNNYLLAEGTNYKKLFSNISLEHIIFIFNMLLLEQKVLLIYKDYEALSNIIFIFISFLFPFSLNNNIFPMLALDNINCLENKETFIAGMDESLFQYINKHNIKLGNDIIIYNVSLNYFISSKNMKKTSRKDILYEYKLVNLPDKIVNFLMKELKNICKEINANLSLYNLINNEESIENYLQLRNLEQNIEYKTKLSFIKSIIMLIGDIGDYTFFSGEKPLFNKESFIEAHKEKDFKIFLNIFLKTNIFNDFLDKQRILYFSQNKNIKEDNIENDIYYFNKISENFEDLINNHQIININSYISNMKKDEIKTKINNICNNLNLINNTFVESNKNHILKKYSKNENIKNNAKSPIHKKKKNILFSGKDYLEDETEIKEKSEINNLKKNNKSIDLYYSYGLKDSKISTENTTLNTYYKLTKKLDLKEEISNDSKLLYININKQKKSNITNKKHTIFKKYLLYPYFLSTKLDEELYIKERKNEEIILKEIQIYKSKKKISEKFPPCTNILYRTLSYLENNNYMLKNNKKYIMPHEDTFQNKRNNMIEYKFNDELISFKNKYYKKKKSEKEIIHLNELFKNDDDIFIINKLFESCFEQIITLKEEHLLSIKKLFSNLENEEYFLNLIVPDKLIKTKFYHKQLNISSFSSFSKIIKIAFENLKISDKNSGRLLTLACFIYYKLDKDKIIYLYNDFIFNKLDKTQQPYQLWSSEIFWIEFFNFEFEKNNFDIEIDIENEDYSENNENEYNKRNEIFVNKNKKLCLIKTIITLTNIMLKLNIEKNFVVNIIEKMILPVFVDDFDFINEIMNLALLAYKSD